MSENKEVEVKKNNENKGGIKMSKEIKELAGEIKENNENKGGIKMSKEIKELAGEIKEKRLLLMEKVLRWSQSLRSAKDVHVKIKGRYYPLIEKETGKLYLIDKVQGKKVPFDTLLDQNMKFAISAVLAERKEQIEKEVEEDKRKYLERKLSEIDKLLNKF